MANRHKAQFAKGGAARKETYEEESHKVEHEAGLKRGGKAHKRATGGKVPGYKSGGRLDKRARGGGVGADKHPFSSAHMGK